jgi:hypothetical protein
LFFQASSDCHGVLLTYSEKLIVFAKYVPKWDMNFQCFIDMTDTEQNILNALIELDSAVKTMASANPKPNLLRLFTRIEELMRQLPKGSDPNLLHYLNKKSYEKARLFLQGRDAENAEGSCGHV